MTCKNALLSQQTLKNADYLTEIINLKIDRANQVLNLCGLSALPRLALAITQTHLNPQQNVTQDIPDWFHQEFPHWLQMPFSTLEKDLDHILTLSCDERQQICFASSRQVCFESPASQSGRLLISRVFKEYGYFPLLTNTNGSSPTFLVNTRQVTNVLLSLKIAQAIDHRLVNPSFSKADATNKLCKAYPNPYYTFVFWDLLKETKEPDPYRDYDKNASKLIHQLLVSLPMTAHRHVHLNLALEIAESIKDPETRQSKLDKIRPFQ